MPKGDFHKIKKDKYGNQIPSTTAVRNKYTGQMEYTGGQSKARSKRIYKEMERDNPPPRQGPPSRSAAKNVRAAKGRSTK